MSDLLDVQIGMYPTILRRMAAGERLSVDGDETEHLAAALLVSEMTKASSFAGNEQKDPVVTRLEMKDKYGPKVGGALAFAHKLRESASPKMSSVVEPDKISEDKKELPAFLKKDDEKSEKKDDEKDEKKNLPPWLKGKSEKKDEKSESKSDEKDEKSEKEEKDEDEKNSADVAVSNIDAVESAEKTDSPSAHAVLSRLLKSFA
jgi:hypothetical protein